ncbi:MAG TPA: TRAP transporter small permease subunit, partial [Rectinema sp.]|nr:TRAP transporter small permease subunit [Rectinema sp.]
LYSKRMGTQVAFTMLYDAAKPKTKRIMRIVGNALLLVAFLIILVPSWDYVQFMRYKKSDALGIPMNIAYFPFVVYLVDMIIRLTIDIAKDFSISGDTK